MNIKKVFENSRIVVERLILQYREYLLLTEEITRLHNEKLKAIAVVAKQNNIPFAHVKLHETDYPELSDHNRRIVLVTRDRDQVADEMTYANHIIWMMYKDYAYRGTSQAIPDWEAFKAHCAPEDYICGKRFRFLEKYLKEHRAVDLKNLFSEKTPLEQVYDDRRIVGLLEDLTFVEQWKVSEYLRTNGIINKWNTTIIS